MGRGYKLEPHAPPTNSIVSARAGAGSDRPVLFDYFMDVFSRSPADGRVRVDHSCARVWLCRNTVLVHALHDALFRQERHSGRQGRIPQYRKRRSARRRHDHGDWRAVTAAVSRRRMGHAAYRGNARLLPLAHNRNAPDGPGAHGCRYANLYSFADQLACLGLPARLSKFPDYP